MNSAGFVYELIAAGAAGGPRPDEVLAPGPNDGPQHTGVGAAAGTWRGGCLTAGPGHGQLVCCAHTLRMVAGLAVASTLARRPGAPRGLALFRRATARAA